MRTDTAEGLGIVVICACAGYDVAVASWDSGRWVGQDGEPVTPRCRVCGSDKISSRVFVVQDSLRKQDGRLVSKFDFKPAEKFGRVEFLFSSSQKPFDSATQAAVQVLTDRLASFSPDDYLLLIGSPVLIGLATAVAARYSPVVRMLQWSTRDYIPVTARLADSVEESWAEVWRRQ